MPYTLTATITENTTLDEIVNAMDDQGVIDSCYCPDTEQVQFFEDCPAQTVSAVIRHTEDGLTYVDCGNSSEPGLMADHIENLLCKHYGWNPECTNTRLDEFHTSLFDVPQESKEMFRWDVIAIRSAIKDTFKQPY